MAKIRIHELAKELKKENKELLQFLTEKGITGKTASSGLDPQEEQMVRDAFGGKAAEKKVEKAQAEAPKAEAKKEEAKPAKPAEAPKAEAPKAETKPEAPKAQRLGGRLLQRCRHGRKTN